MNEDTIVKALPLPYGQRWLWLADANMVLLSDELDEAGRESALCDVQAHWRRSCIRVVEEQPMVASSPPRPDPMRRDLADAL